MILEANQLELEYIKKLVKDNFSSVLSLNVFSKAYVYKENDILGFLIFSMMYERAEIDYIYVLENFRNKQIASKLLDKMFLILKENNVKSVSLEVMTENNTAIGLYEKYNFRKLALRRNYYQNKDAYLMEREVD